MKTSLVVTALVAASVLGHAAAERQTSASIRRLDGSTITTAAAESFARETLAAARVTGAQIAVLDRGRLVHLHFKPGTQYRYSGDGINLVQFVIEQQKGRPSINSCRRRCSRLSA
jgi:CubicO group peptidase (beta-lactamase class C family)